MQCVKARNPPKTAWKMSFCPLCGITPFSIHLRSCRSKMEARQSIWACSRSRFSSSLMTYWFVSWNVYKHKAHLHCECCYYICSHLLPLQLIWLFLEDAESNVLSKDLKRTQIRIATCVHLKCNMKWKHPLLPSPIKFYRGPEYTKLKCGTCQYNLVLNFEVKIITRGPKGP